jgi:hypothetical protein
MPVDNALDMYKKKVWHFSSSLRRIHKDKSNGSVGKFMDLWFLIFLLSMWSINYIDKVYSVSNDRARIQNIIRCEI